MNNYIDDAVNSFRKLLEDQYNRELYMENNSFKKDFSKLKTITVGFVDGDGIGPIIMSGARKLFNTMFSKEINDGSIVVKNIEGLTIENRLNLGKSVPEDVLEAIKSCDVILKGPTTTPKGGTLESANVTLRRELDLFANVRPISIKNENIDWTFFRENTEGEYVLGSKGVAIQDKLAMDFKVTTKEGTKRIARAAFEFARKNGKNNVAIVTKANIMKKTDGMFSEICHEIANEYPDIYAEDWYIDIMAANLVNKDIRNKFQVFLLPNLYGDIITDEAAQIQGGVGTAGSSNVGDQYAMFEAIHGSAPRMIEEGIGEYANPSSIFKATEMLVRHIGYVDKANKLEETLYICNDIEKKYVVTGNKDGNTCEEFTNYVIDKYCSL